VQVKSNISNLGAPTNVRIFWSLPGIKVEVKKIDDEWYKIVQEEISWKEHDGCTMIESCYGYKLHKDWIEYTLQDKLDKLFENDSTN